MVLKVVRIGERSNERCLFRDAKTHLVPGFSLVYTRAYLDQVCQTLWYAERSPWQAAFTAVPNFLISFAQPAPAYFEEHAYTYTYQIVYELPFLPNNTANTNRERWEVVTRYLSLGLRPAGDWANTWYWTERFKSSFQTERSSSPQLLPHFLPHRNPRRGLFLEIIIKKK